MNNANRIQCSKLALKSPRSNSHATLHEFTISQKKTLTKGISRVLGPNFALPVSRTRVSNQAISLSSKT